MRLRNHQKFLALLLTLTMLLSLSETAFAGVQEDPSSSQFTVDHIDTNPLLLPTDPAQTSLSTNLPQNVKVLSNYAAEDLTISTSDTPRRIRKPIAPYSSGAVTPPTTSEEAYQRLKEFQAKYGEGMPWTNHLPYGKDGKTWGYEPNTPVRLPNNTYITSSRGCAAFAFEGSDFIFGNAACTVIPNGAFKYKDVHVGDHLRLYGNSHSVIVWQVTPAGCVVAEANYGGKVHWGRVLSVAEVESADYVVTRWPAGQPIDTGDGDKIEHEDKIGNLSWNLTKAGILTIKGSGAIPDYNNVDNQAPWANLNYNTVIIEDGVTKIGTWAFYGNEENTDEGQSNLMKAIIPGSVKVISANAFRGCKKLISANIPDGVQEIGDTAFRGCISLANADMPGSITKLGSGVFMSCAELKTLIFTNSKNGVAPELGDNLAMYCGNLTTVILPSGLSKIGTGMFQSCWRLTSLSIPKTVKQIGRLAFASSGITTIYYEGTRNDWNRMANGLDLEDLGLPSFGTLDEAISNNRIILEYPFINPFATDDSDLDTDSGTDEHQHRWSATWAYDKVYHWHNCETPSCPITDDSKKDSYELHHYEDGNVCTECQEPHAHYLDDGWTSDESGHWHICLAENCPTRETLRVFTHTYDGVICTACNYEHRHAWSTGENYGKNSEKHWRTCTLPACPLSTDENAAKQDITYHDFTNGDCVCGEKPPAPVHEHRWSEEWTTDETYHWHVCEDRDCPDTNAKDSLAFHEYPTATTPEPPENSDESQSTENTADLTENESLNPFTDAEDSDAPKGPENSETSNPGEPVKCLVCDYEQPEDYSDPSHIWAKTLTNGSTDDSNHHWFACVNPDHEHCDAVNKYAEHIYDQDGNCECGATKPADAHSHTWSDWDGDSTHHWKGCTGCDAKNHYAEHTYDQNGDCECGAKKSSEPGTPCDHVDDDKDNICDKCSETMPSNPTPDPDNPDDPTPAKHTHDWASTWNYDGSYHWHECTNTSGCDNSKDSYSAHEYSPWIIDSHATTYSDGSQHRDCVICGYRQVSSIPATGNSGNSWWNPTPSNPGSTTSPNSPTKPNNSSDDKPKDTSNTTTVATDAGNITITTTTRLTGAVDISIDLPASVISNSMRRDTPISLPISAVQTTRDINLAPAITVNTGMDYPVNVVIPVISPSASTIVTIINSDGSTSILKTSVPQTDGITASLPDNTTIKIVDNRKLFADVTTEAWSADAINFVTARELFSGTSASSFSPAEPMTRAMLMTVLARLDSVNTSTGATWYESGMQWAIDRGISDGSNPDSSITREQLVTMIWRYVGSPSVLHDLSEYTDISNISSYAMDAMSWATKSDIISGLGNGQLDPQGQATREQVAQFLKNFIEYLTTSHV